MPDMQMEVKYQPVAGKTEEDDEDLTSEMFDVEHGKAQFQLVEVSGDMNESKVHNRKFLYIAASAG